MKKSLPILAAMICLLFTACANSPSEVRTDSFQQSSVQSTNNNLRSEKNSASSKTSSVSIPYIEPEAFKQTGTILETVLYDKNNLKITATGLTYNNYEAELELNIENNSETDLEIRSGTMGYCCNSVNGYMVDMGYMICDVAAGKKANNTVGFSYSNLRTYGINEIAEIEIGFDIDAEDIFDDEFEEIYTGPCKIKTSLADNYEYSESTFRKAVSDPAVQGEFGITLNYIADEKLYDSNGISVISEVIATNNNSERMLFLEVVNGMSEEVKLQTSDISLNGLKIYGSHYSYDTINPGKRCIIDVSFDNILDGQYWETCGLNEVNSAGVSVKVLKADETEICAADLAVTADPSGGTFSMDGAEIYNKNGCRIVSKGLFGGESDYDDDLYLLLLAENSSDKTLNVGIEYDSLSVNGYMTDCSHDNAELDAGETQALKIRLYGNSLSKNKIEDVSGVEDIEFEIKVRDDKYHDIDKSVVELTF